MSHSPGGSSRGHDEEKVHAVRSGVDDASALPVASVGGGGSKVTLRAQILGVAICVGGFLFGYDIGVISGLLIFRDFVLRFGGSCTAAGSCSLPDNTSSLFVGMLSVGTFCGAILQAPVSDAFGRRPSMMIWSLMFTLGALIQTTTSPSLHVPADAATNYHGPLAQFVVGRCLAGFGVGGLSALCPLYLAETAPKAVRGTMVSCNQLFIIFGIALSYAIAWGTSNLANESAVSWRVPVGLQLLWGGLLFIIMIFLPESPRYKFQRGDTQGARRIMASMRGIELRPAKSEAGIGGPASSELVGDAAMERDVAEMREGIEREAEAFAGKNFFTGFALCFSTENQMWRRTLTGCMLQILQQLNGQNFYYYYGVTFFSKAELTLSPLAIQFIFGAVSLICTVPALFLIDRLGRRRSLLIGALGEAACSYIVAFVGKYALAPDGVRPDSAQKMAGQAYVAFAVLHLALYSAFWGPGPWVAVAELFPQHLRAKCVSLSSASNWIFNMLLGLFSNKIASKYGSFIMLIFGSVLVFAAFFVYFVVNETAYLSLEQIDEMFSVPYRSLPAWRSSQWRPAVGDDLRTRKMGPGEMVGGGRDGDGHETHMY